jgi:hypothetical protein
MPESGWIALLNGASGLAFLWAVVYGQRAYADMDPLAMFRASSKHDPGVPSLL